MKCNTCISNGECAFQKLNYSDVYTCKYYAATEDVADTVKTLFEYGTDFIFKTPKELKFESGKITFLPQKSDIDSFLNPKQFLDTDFIHSDHNSTMYTESFTEFAEFAPKEVREFRFLNKEHIQIIVKNPTNESIDIEDLVVSIEPKSQVDLLNMLMHLTTEQIVESTYLRQYLTQSEELPHLILNDGMMDLKPEQAIYWLDVLKTGLENSTVEFSEREREKALTYFEGYGFNSVGIWMNESSTIPELIKPEFTEDKYNFKSLNERLDKIEHQLEELTQAIAALGRKME